MDDSLLHDYDRGYRSRRNSTSSSDGTSESLPLHDIGRGIARHIHKHHRSRSHGSETMNSAGGSGSGAGAGAAAATGGGGGSSGLQERIFAKLMQQMLPSDYSLENYTEPRDRRRDKNRPQFSLTTMSSNFRRFNARCALTSTVSWKEQKES